MSLKRAMAIAASALSAQRTRLELVASNLANARTTRTPGGGPYRRRLPVFVAQPLAASPAQPLAASLQAVRVARVVEDPSPFLRRYEPGHPDADEAGFVAYPNVDPLAEMVDLLTAARSYEANVTLVRAAREMLRNTLQILV